MILLDVNGTMWCDDANWPSPEQEEILRRNGAVLVKCDNMDVLYRFNDDGELIVYDVSGPQFHHVNISMFDRSVFKKKNEVYTSGAHILDVGADICRVLGDEFEFVIPKELLMRW